MQVFETGETFVANEWPAPYDADNDGTVEDHWFNVAYSALRDLDGAVTGIVAVSTDVTAQVLARKELERVNRELEEFSYVASHDLQEPLRMVNIYSQLLLRSVGEPSLEMSRYAGFVRQGVNRMETLLTDLLTFSRAVHTDRGAMGEANLTESLQEALAVLHSDIEYSSAVITAGALPIVRGDTQQLMHVFQNLLSNALKYRRKELLPAIDISAEHNGPEWTISVSDNGIGFDQQYSERIFGLFKRLHRDEYPGTGLGLAICQRIIARYGGKIWAEGKLGQGSIFHFTLPEP
jgi:light-regulated signal transduction histidine kinase (bacteriophytochrome)